MCDLDLGSIERARNRDATSMRLCFRCDRVVKDRWKGNGMALKRA